MKNNLKYPEYNMIYKTMTNIKEKNTIKFFKILSDPNFLCPISIFLLLKSGLEGCSYVYNIHTKKKPPTMVCDVYIRIIIFWMNEFGVVWESKSN